MNFDQIKNTESKENLFTWEQSIELAKNLLEKYRGEIKTNQGKDIDGFDNGNVYSDYQKSIIHFLEQVPKEIQALYTGHGITRGSELEKLAAAISIIANKSIRGDTGQLKDSIYLDTYTKGDFVVLSRKGENLVDLNPDETGRNVPSFNFEKAWQANIGAFVIDVKYYPLVEELRKRFPNVNIIRANELPNYFELDK